MLGNCGRQGLCPPSWGMRIPIGVGGLFGALLGRKQTRSLGRGRPVSLTSSPRRNGAKGFIHKYKKGEWEVLGEVPSGEPDRLFDLDGDGEILEKERQALWRELQAREEKEKEQRQLHHSSQQLAQQTAGGAAEAGDEDWDYNPWGDTGVSGGQAVSCVRDSTGLHGDRGRPALTEPVGDGGGRGVC